MKRKVFAGTTLTLFLVVALFSAVPAESQFVGTIKIGVVGPMPWIHGRGMSQGAKLAAKQINEAGGIKVDWGPGWTKYPTKQAYEVEIVLADTLRGQPHPTPATGTVAAMELVAAGVHLVIGFFRTEAAMGGREVLADAGIPLLIAGAATNELIDCAAGTCDACVRCDYARYKYMFRVTPNSTTSLETLAALIQFVLETKLVPIYGFDSVSPVYGPCKQVGVAVISEDLTWCDIIHSRFTNPAEYPYVLGKHANVTYHARVSPVATDVSSELLAAKADGAKLIIEVLSGLVGQVLPVQWQDLGIPAFLAGINSQKREFWVMTDEKCEYETILAVSGTRTPVSSQFIAFWDASIAEYGEAPIYTSYGAYEAVRAIKETIERVNKWPMTAEEQIPHMEKTFRVIDRPEVVKVGLTPGPAMLGTFKYTGPHPMSPATYNATWTNGTHGALDVNPAMMGTLHDTFMTDLDPIWYPPYYTRPFVVQSQKHPITEELRLEVVFPINMPYSKKIRIPPWMYSHADTDVCKVVGVDLVTGPDGLVDSDDMDIGFFTWLSKPGDPAWVADGQYYGLEADQDSNGFINIADVAAIAKEYGYSAIDEYGQWPLP